MAKTSRFLEVNCFVQLFFKKIFKIVHLASMHKLFNSSLLIPFLSLHDRYAEVLAGFLSVVLAVLLLFFVYLHYWWSPLPKLEFSTVQLGNYFKPVTGLSIFKRDEAGRVYELIELPRNDEGYGCVYGNENNNNNGDMVSMNFAPSEKQYLRLIIIGANKIDFSVEVYNLGAYGPGLDPEKQYEKMFTEHLEGWYHVLIQAR